MPDTMTPVGVTIVALPGGSVPQTATGTETIATTADHMPDLVVRVISPLVAIAIRTINTYLTILTGLVAAGMTSDAIPSDDFTHLVVKCAGLSVAGAGVGLLKDFVTMFAKLESKYPLLTGNV